MIRRIAVTTLPTFNVNAFTVLASIMEFLVIVGVTPFLQMSPPHTTSQVVPSGEKNVLLFATYAASNGKINSNGYYLIDIQRECIYHFESISHVFI